MFSSRCFVLGFLLGACAETGAIAPDAPRETADAAEVLRDLTARYAALQSYQDKGSQTLVPGTGHAPAGRGQIIVTGPPREVLTFRTWYMAPSRFRFEWKSTNEHLPNVIVSDGSRTVVCSQRTCACEDSPSLAAGVQRAEELGGGPIVPVASLLGLASPNRVASLVEVSAARSGQRLELRGRDTMGWAERPTVMVLNPQGWVGFNSRGPPKTEPARLREAVNGLAANFPDPTQRTVLLALLEMTESSTTNDSYEDIQTNQPIPDDLFRVPTIDTSTCARKKP